ncbi:MAG: hypothetical protein ABSF91_07390 [Bacteroidota bacterium]|jgi:hypothetical protein
MKYITLLLLVPVLVGGCGGAGLTKHGTRTELPLKEIQVKPHSQEISFLTDTSRQEEEYVVVDSLSSSSAPYGRHDGEFVRQEAIDEAVRDGADAILNLRFNVRAHMVPNAPNQYEKYATGKLITYRKNILRSDSADLCFRLPEGFYYTITLTKPRGATVEHVQHARRDSYIVRQSSFPNGLYKLLFEACEKVAEDSWAVRWVTARWIWVGH